MKPNEEAWIQTYTGKKYPLLNPKPEDICVEDIAHALSNVCRFSGHCREFYSVAQHSVLCSFWIHKSGFEFEALMHDSSEAYLTDISRPLKYSSAMVGYRELEAKTEKVLAEKFGIPYPKSELVKKVDDRMLSTENRDLRGSKVQLWGGNVKPFNFIIEAWEPKKAEKAFIERYHQLGGI